MLGTQRGHVTGFNDPYVLAFSPTHIEVRHLETGALVQTIWIKHSLLSTSPELLMIQAQDGRLIGLDISESGGGGGNGLQETLVVGMGGADGGPTEAGNATSTGSTVRSGCLGNCWFSPGRRYGLPGKIFSW